MLNSHQQLACSRWILNTLFIIPLRQNHIDKFLETYISELGLHAIYKTSLDEMTYYIWSLNVINR